MSRWAPEILSALLDEQSGALVVEWRVGDFQDSEPPDRVFVEEGHGFSSGLLNPDETSYSIDQTALTKLANLGVSQLTIQVVFQWGAETVDDELRDGLQIANPYSQRAIGGTSGPDRPQLTATARARTMAAPAAITVTWKSNNWTEGRIAWGPIDQPRVFLHKFKPGPGHYNPEIDRLRYNGEWTTDESLEPSTVYSFSVAVRNPQESPDWVEATIAVRSADEILSIREYMVANGLRPGTRLWDAIGNEVSTHMWLTGRPGA